MPANTDHNSFAAALRRRVLEGAGETASALRQSVATRAAGGASIQAPFDDLARQIGESAYRTTDAQVADVRTAAGSEKATFEIIASAAVGAGLLRWNQAITALESVTDATTRD